MTRLVTIVDADDVEYPLDDAHGVRLNVGAEGLQASPVELRTAPRSAGAGDVLLRTRSPAATLVVPVTLFNLALAETWAEVLSERPARIVVTSDTRTRELVDVYYVAGLEGVETRDRQGYGWHKVILEFRALSPHWLDAVQSLTLTTPNVNDDYDAAVGYDEPSPYDGPGIGLTAGAGYDTAVGYDGATPYDGGVVVPPPITSRLGAWPYFEARGPATSLSILHLRTGERLTLRDGQTLGSGVTLKVSTDPAARDATVNGQPAWNRLTDDSSATLELLPGDQLAVTMGGTNSESIVTVSWQQRWRTP